MVIGFADKKHMSEFKDKFRKIPAINISMNRQPPSPLLPTPPVLPVTIINTSVPPPITRAINPLPITFNPRNNYYHDSNPIK